MRRSAAEEQIGDLLRRAKDTLHLSVAFLTRMDGVTQFLEVVEAPAQFPLQDGSTQVQATSLCEAIREGRLPAVMTDLSKHPAAKRLPAGQAPGVRSFVSVPVTLSDGTQYGTFCALGLTSDARITKRDKSVMDVLAHAAAMIIEPDARIRHRQDEIQQRLAPVIDAGGPHVVLQPIVELFTGARIGAEALSRFPTSWDRTPDVCFAEAHEIGEGHRLELLAIERAAEYLERVEGYVAMNVSPKTLVTPACTRLLTTLPLDRILLELSENEQVTDYAALASVLVPLRARGLRLAIDDVGAGFSSLRHIVLTAPDVIKLDRRIVAGVSTDPVLATLVRCLVDFSHSCGADVVAEGVEVAADAAALTALDVDFGQGWYFGRPGPPEALESCEQPAERPAHVGSLVGRAMVGH